MKFNDAHEFMNFNDEWDKQKWWKGRLVKTKYQVRSSLFEPWIAGGTLGIVLNVYKTEAFGDSLIVYWTNCKKSTEVNIHEVYSHA